MWTKDETDVTTTNITADKESIFIDQFTSNVPELIQVAIIVVYYRNSGTIRVEEIDKLKG